MPEQLVFDLPVRPAMGRSAFFVAPANAAAVAQVEGWRDWPHGKLVLCGPSGAGKTHLAHVWAAQTGADIWAADDLRGDKAAERAADRAEALPALAIDGADRIAGSEAETALFHIHNICAAREVPLLLTASTAPGQWGLRLPDLHSRMMQAGLAQLAPPDDALLMAVLLKLADDRGLALSPRLVGLVTKRIERSFAAAHLFIARLDGRALAAKRPPTLDDAKAVLAEMDAPVPR